MMLKLLVHSFEDNMKNCHGQYTAAQASRTSKIVGSPRKAFDQTYVKNVMSEYIAKPHRTRHDDKTDVHKFVHLYQCC